MSIKISLKFVPKGPINNIPALVHIMSWCRPGNKPLSEPVVRLLTHICVTRPQWVLEHLQAQWHRSTIPKFVTPTALSCIDNSWRSTTLSPPKKLTSSTANLEWCHVHFIRDSHSTFICQVIGPSKNSMELFFNAKFDFKSTWNRDSTTSHHHSGETDEANCSWLHPIRPPPKRPDQDNTFCVVSIASTEIIFCLHRDFDARNNVYKPRRLVCQCCGDISAWKSRVMKPTGLGDEANFLGAFA